MKKILNTLFITSKDAFLSLENENIVVTKSNDEIKKFPLVIFEAIYSFSYKGATTQLMGKCCDLGIDLVFHSPQGNFLARVTGKSRGNVLLRKEQYRISDNENRSCKIAKNFIFGKVYNCRQLIERIKRDHPLQLDVEKLKSISTQLKNFLEIILSDDSLDVLRGHEGICANLYFSIFNELILNKKEEFIFKDRNRRPPLDRVNAMLSYMYTLLGNQCVNALETVGLDAYVGFMHRDKPGRTSLAQDLLEELRASIADRFVLTLLNNRIIGANDFIIMENGAVILNDDGKSKINKHWQDNKMQMIIHPFLNEKVEWGMVPYVQALLLARYIRGDLDEYPPFLYK